MKVCSEKDCTFCSACVDVCPQGCISIKTNEYGFKYPFIIDSNCVECGKCNSVCHILNEVDKLYPQKAYAVWSNDPNDRKTSASGGAASVFYKKILNSGGYCFGASYDENLKVIIKGYANQRVKEFKQSKYVHSYMNSCFSEIKKLLTNGLKVLFIGLPCQVASIKRFLNKEYENLILVDLVCHGTPPISYLIEHIHYIRENTKSDVDSINFRDVEGFKFTAYYDKKVSYSKHKSVDTYLLSFLESLTYYDSCYECKYACNERCSDITIGDFWGLGSEVPFNHPYSGDISLVLINSPKGKTFFDSVRNNLFCEERTVKEAIKGNEQLNFPSKRNNYRDRFLELYKSEGFETAVNEIYKKTIKKNRIVLKKNNCKYRIRSIAKRIFRR